MLRRAPHRSAYQRRLAEEGRVLALLGGLPAAGPDEHVWLCVFLSTAAYRRVVKQSPQINLLDHEPHLVLLSFDIKNCFNAVSRARLFRELAARRSQAAPR